MNKKQLTMFVKLLNKVQFMHFEDNRELVKYIYDDFNVIIDKHSSDSTLPSRWNIVSRQFKLDSIFGAINSMPYLSYLGNTFIQLPYFDRDLGLLKPKYLVRPRKYKYDQFVEVAKLNNAHSNIYFWRERNKIVIPQQQGLFETNSLYVWRKYNFMKTLKQINNAKKSSSIKGKVR